MAPRSFVRGGMLREESDRRSMVASAETAILADVCPQHKVAIGQCGCGGGSSRSIAMVASPQTVLAVAQPGSATPGDAGGWVIVPPPARGAYPRSLCDQYGQPMGGWSRAMREVMAQGHQEPYLDPAYDWANMDVIYSTPTTATPGVAVNVDLSPEIGTFALFYYRIVAVDPATRVQQVDWDITRPSVPGCPLPCATTGTILAPFVMAEPEACCGIPLAAFLDERTRNVPLRTVFTNQQAAGDLLVQIEGRGYCCSERIC